MREIEVHVVDAFTTIRNKGNRAGVVLDAASLGIRDMQAIAAFAGYSETAFVLPPEDESHRVRVRYFTPTDEVPICGHATVAAHFLRVTLGHADEYPLIARTGAGNLPIALQGSGSSALVSMTQGRPSFEDPFDAKARATLASALGIAPLEFADLPVQIVSTGHSKVMVPLKRRVVLDALQPDLEQLSAISREIECNGFFPFVIEGTQAAPVTYGRMFAPAIGIAEDPVTGNANGPAGAYLVRNGLVAMEGSITYPGHQGIALGKPGTVHVTVEHDGVDDGLRVAVAGEAVHAGVRRYTLA